MKIYFEVNNSSTTKKQLCNNFIEQNQLVKQSHDYVKDERRKHRIDTLNLFDTKSLSIKFWKIVNLNF